MTVKINTIEEPLLGLDLIPIGATIAVAVSGGGDSVALLHIISKWAKEGRAKPHVFTVDHQLRPESANEAIFVAELCSTLGLPHTTLIWSRPKSSQKAARKARHRMIAEAARTVGAKYILLGHTLNDVAETMLMREQRDNDIQKVAGPMPVSVSPIWPEGRDMTLLRPLLLVDRSTIRQWLEARALSWIDDPSNENDTFERARIRKAIVKSGGPGLARAKRALEARSAEERALAPRLRECAKGCDAQGLIRVTIDFGAAMLADLMAILIPAASGTDLIPKKQTRLSAVSRLLESKGTRLTLGGAWLQRSGDDILMGRAPDKPEFKTYDDVFDGRFKRCDDSVLPTEKPPFLVRHAMPPSTKGWQSLIPDRLNLHASVLEANDRLLTTPLEVFRS